MTGASPNPNGPATNEPMRFAYADPPYLGCCNLYGHEHGPEGLCWDESDTHRLLIERLCAEWPERDVRSHVTEGGFCWCSPWLEEQGSGVIITHNDELDRWYDEECARPIPILPPQETESDSS